MADFVIGNLDQEKFFAEKTSTKILALRKVYILFFIQFACVAENLHISWLYDEDYVPWIFQHEEIFWITVIAQLILFFGVIALKDTFRSSPLNWITYLVWTALIGYNMGYLGVWYDERGSLLMICAVICFTSLALLVYAYTTKYDLTYTGGTLFIIASVALGYEVFLISTDLPFWVMFLITAAGIFFGYYYIYSTQHVIISQGITSDFEDPWIASILIYKEILLIPCRLYQGIKALF